MRGKHRPNQSSDWEDYHDIIQRLYVTEDRSLQDVVDEMRRKYQFYATERQYKRRITEWQLDKNVKDEEMRAIIAAEAMRVRQGKKSTFQVRGRIVSRKEIDRFIQRKRIDRNALDSLPGMQQFADSSHHAASEYAPILPESVRCSTPPDDRTALLDISKSYRGLIPAQDTTLDAMAIDIESYNTRKLDYPTESVKILHDMGTKVTALNEALALPNPSASTNTADGTATSDGQNKHGLADTKCLCTRLADYMCSLKGNFVENIPCCGTILTSLHELLLHYDEQHSESPKQSWNFDSYQHCSFADRVTSITDTAGSSGDSGRLSSMPVTGMLEVIPEPSIHRSSSQSSGPEVSDIHIEIDSREPYQRSLDELQASLDKAASDAIRQVQQLFSSIESSLARRTLPSQTFFNRVRNCLDRIIQLEALPANASQMLQKLQMLQIQHIRMLQIHHTSVAVQGETSASKSQ